MRKRSEGCAIVVSAGLRAVVVRGGEGGAVSRLFCAEVILWEYADGCGKFESYILDINLDK